MKLCIGTAKGIALLDLGGRPSVVAEGPSTAFCVARDHFDPNLLYAGKASHSTANFDGRNVLSRSTDGGRTWQAIGVRELQKEEVWAITPAPDQARTVYVGASHGRILKSTDGGESFQECVSFLKMPGRDHWSFPPPPHVPHVRSIAFDPADPATFYAGVEEGGVFRTRDRGESFEPLNEGLYDDVHTVRVDPHDSTRLYATTGRGFYLSENGGASWRQITNGVHGYTVPLLVSNGGQVRIYTAEANQAPPAWYERKTGAEAALLCSLDRGQSFEPVAVPRLAGGAMIMSLAENPQGGFFGALNDGSVIAAHGDQVEVVAEGLPRAYDVVALA